MQYIQFMTNHMYSLRGTATPNQKWSCFVLYLKIINIFFEK